MKTLRSRRRRNIQWDTPKRMVLCCLFRFFRRENRKWEEIFSHMFRSHLTERGITGFIPFTTLNIQWVNMREHGNPIWHRVHIATDFKKDGEWQDTILSIHSAAQALRLEIQEKDEDSVDTSRWRYSGTALAARTRQLSSAAVSNNPPDSPASAPATTRLMEFAWNGIEDLETSPYFAHSEDQYDIEATDMTTDDEVKDEADDKSEHNTPSESNQSVVTSHGKRCLWCEQEAPLADEQNDCFEFVPASVHDLEEWNNIQREQSSPYENQPDQEQCQSQMNLNQRYQSNLADHFMQTLTRVPASCIFDLNIEDKDSNRDEDESASVLSALQREWPSDDYDHDPDTPTPHPRRDAIMWGRKYTPGPHECE